MNHNSMFIYLTDVGKQSTAGDRTKKSLKIRK